MKIYLIDGTFELFRAYYAGIPGKSPSGQDVGATRGFLRSMISLIKAGQPCHLAVAFDHVIESFRNDLFEGYKTGEGMDRLTRFEVQRSLAIVPSAHLEVLSHHRLQVGKASYPYRHMLHSQLNCNHDIFTIVVS